MDTFAALANLANLKKLKIENMGLDLTRFNDDARHLKPLASLKELSLELNEFRGGHTVGRKFFRLISTMFPNLAHFELYFTNHVSKVAYLQL